MSETVEQDVGTSTPAAGATQNADAGNTAATKTDDSSTAPQAPDTEYEFKVPDGVEFDQASLDEFKTVLKDKTLTEPQRAQKIVDLAAKREQARVDAYAAQVSKWADEVKADKELGTGENLATARKAIDLGPPELKDLLNSTGMGNHPAVVRWALAVGRALSEDRFVAGRTGGNAQPRDAASILYGGQKAA